HDQQRVQYVSVDDEMALDGFQTISRLEGIIPALESAHAVADAMRVAPTMRRDQVILINLSGRGDKDIFSVANVLGVDI
ncbi:MAG: tryptophan synthase subunit beta, partial [Roseiflexaceae bacterium]